MPRQLFLGLTATNHRKNFALETTRFFVFDKLAVPAVPKMCEGRIYGLESVPLDTCHTVRTLVGSLESLDSDVSLCKDQSCHLSVSKSLALLCGKLKLLALNLMHPLGQN